MVREHVGEYSPLSHRDALSPSEIILGDNCTCQLVMSAHKVSGHAADELSIEFVGYFSLTTIYNRY